MNVGCAVRTLKYQSNEGQGPILSTVLVINSLSEVSANSLY